MVVDSVTSMTYLSIGGAPSFTSALFSNLTNVASLAFQDLDQDLILKFSSLQLINELLTIATPISTNYRECKKGIFQDFRCALEPTLPTAHHDMTKKYPRHIRK
jgi:hypothetical protein